MHGVTPQSLWPQELHLSCNDFIAQVLQCLTIENQKSPVYVVHLQFSKLPTWYYC